MYQTRQEPGCKDEYVFFLICSPIKIAMNKQELLNTVRDLISEAQTGEALDLLEREWTGKPELKVLLREVLAIGALYNKTKNDETRGIISFDNAQLSYNRVHDRLLTVLEHFENDRFEPEGLARQEKSKSSRWWLWALLLPLAAVLFFLLKPDILSGGGTTGGKKSLCPEFGRKAMKIMVLPFYKVNREAGQPEGLFAEKLESFCAKCRLDVAVRINEQFEPVKLLNYEEAGRFAKRCGADMVVWGRTEFADGRNILKTRYKFADGRQLAVEWSKLEWGENQFDTVRVLSDIASDRTFTADIEEVILLAIGSNEMMEGRTDNAACLLSSFEARDSQVMVTKSMLLAENYLRSGNPAAALEAYDELLAKAPDNWLALNNRGMILLQEGNYLQAINDFSAVISKKEDPAVLYARAKAYQSSEQLSKAEVDLEKVVKLSPELAPKAKTELETTRKEIQLQEGIIEELEPQPTNQLNTTKYITKVDAYSRLGNNQKAIQLVEKGLEVKPLDPKLTAKKIELLLKENKEEQAVEELKAAKEKGISVQELSRHSEVVAQFIKEMQMQRKSIRTYKRLN